MDVRNRERSVAADPQLFRSDVASPLPIPEGERRRGKMIPKGLGSMKKAAKFGQAGGSVTSEAKAAAARMNGMLGGRPSTRNAPRETFDLRTAIARYQRIRLLKSSIETILAADSEALERSERTLLKQCVREISRIEKRVSVAVEEHQLKPA